MTEEQIIIGIPGKWKNRTEIIQSVASKSEGYLMAGHIIHNAKKNIGFQVEVYEHEPQLRDAFNYAGKGSFDDNLLNEIEEHTFTVYVIANTVGFDSVRDIVDVGVGILKSGGIAVKIESSGIAHSRDTWLKLSESKEYFPLYSHFVTLIGDDDCYYSCGMKVFGLPDIVTPSTISPEDASELLNNFNLYHMVENPTFKSGDTFSIGENTPILKISKLEDFRYNEEDIFFNQFGLLDLSPLE